MAHRPTARRRNTRLTHPHHQCVRLYVLNSHTPSRLASSATDPTLPASKSSAHRRPRAMALSSVRSTIGAGARLTLDNQTHLEAAPPDLHREDARDLQRGGVRTEWFFRGFNRQLERNPDAGIGEINSIDQRVQDGAG